MVQVDNLLPHAILPRVHPRALLALSPPQPVQAQQIAVLCLHDVLFRIVSVQRAQVGKVVRFGNGSRAILGPRLVVLSWGEVVEELLGAVVAELDKGLREEEGDDADQGFEDDEEGGDDEGEVLAPGMLLLCLEGDCGGGSR